MLGPSPLPRSSHKVKAEKTVPRRSEGFTFISTARMLGPDIERMRSQYAHCQAWRLRTLSPASAADPPQRAKKKAKSVGRPDEVVISACEAGTEKRNARRKIRKYAWSLLCGGHWSL